MGEEGQKSSTWLVKFDSPLLALHMAGIQMLAVSLLVHFFFFFNFLGLFIYLFMAVLGLRFCARAFSSCGKWGPLFITVRGPLIIAASLVAEHRLQTRRLSKLWLTGLVAPWHVGSSQTRARTRVSCIGRQILNHCATREALLVHSCSAFMDSLEASTGD